MDTGNTSPGSDDITVKLLRAAWPAIGNLVRELYEGCITLGHHRKAFKEAEVVMITKPGKRDLTSPRAWRPISLLSCLGKGLERLVARRLAWAAVHYAVLHIAFSERKVATLVTMDIQGAFDTVMRNRLILRLRQQGWPLPLVKWAASFMSNRAARVRYQDITTEYAPLLCGLPQGSPASPILFLLYTKPIYKLGFQLGRLSYADNTAILKTGRTLRETAKLATADVRELISWGAANSITFDPEKTEVMHFSHKKDDTSPSVTHGGITKIPAEAIHWLGIWLDKKLTF
ncbi:reverse transcriptase, partial [Metarhizium majus ARSEF 297]